MKRKSRNRCCGCITNCCLLTSSCANPPTSSSRPAPNRPVKYGPLYSLKLAIPRGGGGGSSDSVASIVFCRLCPGSPRASLGFVGPAFGSASAACGDCCANDRPPQTTVVAN